MPSLYVIHWIILIVTLLAYIVLGISLIGNSSTLNSETSVILELLKPHNRYNYVRSVMKDSKLILRDMSILMLVSAVMLAILPITYSMEFSGICIIVAFFNYCHYMSINV